MRRFSSFEESRLTQTQCPVGISHFAVSSFTAMASPSCSVCRLFKQHLPERLEIGAVTEATGRDGDEFATFFQHQESKRDKSRILVRCLDADRPQGLAMVRNRPQFLVGRIQDGMRELRRRAVSDAFGSREDEVLSPNLGENALKGLYACVQRLGKMFPHQHTGQVPIRRNETNAEAPFPPVR